MDRGPRRPDAPIGLPLIRPAPPNSRDVARKVPPPSPVAGHTRLICWGLGSCPPADFRGERAWGDAGARVGPSQTAGRRVREGRAYGFASDGTVTKIAWRMARARSSASRAVSREGQNSESWASLSAIEGLSLAEHSRHEGVGNIGPRGDLCRGVYQDVFGREEAEKRAEIRDGPLVSRL